MADSDSISAKDFFESQNRFSTLSQPDQILRAAWYLHTYRGFVRFQPKDLTGFFAELHLSPPNIHTNIKRLYGKKPRALLWDKNGYYVEGNQRTLLDDKCRVNHEPVKHHTSQSLKNIADQIAEDSQKTYLAEAMKCYSAGAFRATIVMTWNLAYDHFIRWLLLDADRIKSFNNSLAVKYPKSNYCISALESFSEFKEFQVIETARHANLITKNLGDILKDKLNRRNAAAHPANMVFTQAQADDTVTDLINNVIANLSHG